MLYLNTDGCFRVQQSMWEVDALHKLLFFFICRQGGTFELCGLVALKLISYKVAAGKERTDSDLIFKYVVRL